MRYSVPSVSYSSVCNVLRQRNIPLIPTYRVYRLYDIYIISLSSSLLPPTSVPLCLSLTSPPLSLPPACLQVVLFTFTIPHKRAEFLFDSRILFESLFLVNFNPEMPLRQQVAYSIDDISSELDFVVKNVREGGREGKGE